VGHGGSVVGSVP